MLGTAGFFGVSGASAVESGVVSVGEFIGEFAGPLAAAVTG